MRCILGSGEHWPCEAAPDDCPPFETHPCCGTYGCPKHHTTCAGKAPMNTGMDPIERLIQQAKLIGANAAHGAARRVEKAEQAERDGDEAARLCALAFVEMYQGQQDGAARLETRLRAIRSAADRHRAAS
jgi:hypothetical protein